MRHPLLSAAGCPKDLADVLGQAEGRHAVEVCAAGGHNLFLVGPAGRGQDDARRAPPRACSPNSTGRPPWRSRPSTRWPVPWHPGSPPHRGRAPAAEPAPHGPRRGSDRRGWVRGAAPGMASLAHRGVLFMDEAPEFFPGMCSTRCASPWRRGRWSLRRASRGGPVSRPGSSSCSPPTLARAGSPTARGCECTMHAFRAVALPRQLSGPLLDRVDLRVALQPVDRTAMLADLDVVGRGEWWRGRSARARAGAARWLGGTPWRTNAEVPGPEGGAASARRRYRGADQGGGRGPFRARLRSGDARGVDAVRSRRARDARTRRRGRRRVLPRERGQCRMSGGSAGRPRRANRDRQIPPTGPGSRRVRTPRSDRSGGAGPCCPVAKPGDAGLHAAVGTLGARPWPVDRGAGSRSVRGPAWRGGHPLGSPAPLPVDPSPSRTG